MRAWWPEILQLTRPLARIIHETEGDDVFWPKVHGEAGGKIDQSPVELLHT
jgi:hypothetical protein